MGKPRWTMVEVVDRTGEVPREVLVNPDPFFRKGLDSLLPKNAVVVRFGSGFALDLVESGKREPFIEEPLPWHEFVAALLPAQATT